MSTPSIRTRPAMRPRARRLAAAAMAVAIVLLLPASASAHGTGESDKAFDLVRQAIALIVNTPSNMDAITDKIDDAIDAKDTANVQLPMIQQAKDAMETGDLHQVRRLLEQSIGARVHTGPADPVPIGNPAPAVGADTGTVATVEGLPGRHGLTGGDWILLAVSLVAGLGGLALAIRLRPHRPSPSSDPQPAR